MSTKLSAAINSLHKAAMDPDAAIDAIYDLVREYYKELELDDESKEDLETLVDGLEEWLGKKGFEPSNKHYQKILRIAHKVLDGLGDLYIWDPKTNWVKGVDEATFEDKSLEDQFNEPTETLVEAKGNTVSTKISSLINNFAKIVRAQAPAPMPTQPAKPTANVGNDPLLNELLQLLGQAQTPEIKARVEQLLDLITKQEQAKKTAPKTSSKINSLSKVAEAEEERHTECAKRHHLRKTVPGEYLELLFKKLQNSGLYSNDDDFVYKLLFDKFGSVSILKIDRNSSEVTLEQSFDNAEKFIEYASA